MSRETLTHLNTQTLIGFTDERGHAWHYRAEEQRTEPNHYPQAVPVPDVHRRLFHWSPVEAEISANVITADGVETFHDPTRKGIFMVTGKADELGAHALELLATV